MKRIYGGNELKQNGSYMEIKEQDSFILLLRLLRELT